MKLSKKTGTSDLQLLGYLCARETVGGYRVRDRNGKLAVYEISTHTTARQAWAEASRIARREA